MRGLSKLLDQEWWPLEVAVVWVATGDVALSTAAFGLVIERRSSGPLSKLPRLATWLMTYEGRATLYEATPGAIYRKRIRDNWKPGDRNGLHPLDNAMAETAAILKSHLRSKRGRARDTRRLARGQQTPDEVTWIPTRVWSHVKLVDHRQWGMMIFPDTHQKGHWRYIDVLAEPFKALGADRGRQTLAQARESLANAEKNNDRIRAKLAKHDRKMGRPAKKRRGRPVGEFQEDCGPASIAALKDLFAQNSEPYLKTVCGVSAGVRKGKGAFALYALPDNVRGTSHTLLFPSIGARIGGDFVVGPGSEIVLPGMRT